MDFRLQAIGELGHMKHGILLLLFWIAQGCANHAKDYPLVMDQLFPVRLDAGDSANRFQIDDGSIVAVQPPNRESDRPVETLAVLKDFDGQDVSISGRVTVASGATAGYLFRTRGQSGLVTSTYALVFDEQGVGLWQLTDRGWTALNRRIFPLEANVPHVLRADAKGDKIDVMLDEQPLFTSRDTTLVHAGGVGLYARNGICAFKGVTVECHDARTSASTTQSQSGAREKSEAPAGVERAPTAESPPVSEK